MSLTFSETPSHIVIPTRVSLAAYGAVLLSKVDNGDLLAGANNLDVAAVPAGKVHVYTNLNMLYVGTTTAVMLRFQIVAGANVYNLFGQYAPLSTLDYDRQGWWVLEAGDVLRLRVDGATLHDWAFLCATGFVVDLT